MDPEEQSQLEEQLSKLTDQLEAMEAQFLSGDEEEEEAPVETKQDFSTLIFVDNLPVIDKTKEAKLMGMINKIYGQVGNFSAEPVMPFGADGKTRGFALIDFETKEQAAKAVAQTNGWRLDAKHIFAVRPYAEVARLLDLQKEYVPLPEKKHVTRPDPNHWLLDPSSRDQFVLRYGNETEIFWADNEGECTLDYGGQREKAGGKNWCEQYVMWSPDGSYLATHHQQGIALWGGEKYDKYRRLAHPSVQASDFSPCGRFMVTYGPHTERACVVWQISNTRALRYFSKAQMSADGKLCKLKWSPDGNYIAKMGGDMLSIYTLPSMKLHMKSSVRAVGIKDFVWSPTDNTLAYWAPGDETGQTPARVVMLAVKAESREAMREKNLFTVKDCRLDWHPQGNYLAVKATRSSKTGKTTYTSFEIFRAREPACPVDSLEQTERVVAFSFEPHGDRFCVAHGDGNVVLTVTFYNLRGGNNGKKLEEEWVLPNKKCNRIYWSPQGQYVVLAGLGDGMNGVMEFWNAATKTQLGKEQEHYRCSHISWDPSGRMLCTAVCQSLGGTYYKSMMDNGYVLWSFQGEKLLEVSKESFYQFLWRPRPKSVLSAAKTADIVKNLKKYEKKYTATDKEEKRIKKKEKAEKKAATMAAFYAKVKATREWYKDTVKPGIATILGYDPEDPKNAVMPFEESVEIIQDRMGRAVEEVVRKA